MMVAVNPTRLKFQINDLMTFFESPVEFRQNLHALFSLYANYALRLGDNEFTRSLIPRYNLPHPVIRQLNADLQLLIDKDPQSALKLADELWKDEYYEVKYLAIYILSIFPIKEDPHPVLNRIRTWLTPNLERILKSDLLAVGTSSLQKDFPQAWEDLIASLLMSDKTSMTSLGLVALTESIKQPNFKNLPVVFRLLTPFFHNLDTAYFQDLENLIQVLADISPEETSYFLRQIVILSNSPNTLRLIKSCLPYFPQKAQNELKRFFAK